MSLNGEKKNMFNRLSLIISFFYDGKNEVTYVKQMITKPAELLVLIKAAFVWTRM